MERKNDVGMSDGSREKMHRLALESMVGHAISVANSHGLPMFHFVDMLKPDIEVREIVVSGKWKNVKSNKRKK